MPQERADFRPIVFSGADWSAQEQLRGVACEPDTGLCATAVSDISTDTYLALRDGNFDSQFGSSRAALSHAFGRFRAGGSPRLALFFHGGLVNAKSGLCTAMRLVAPYSSPAAGGTYPMFTIWESGILDVLADRWRHVVQTDLFTTLFDYVAKQLGVSRSSVMSEAEFTPTQPVRIDPTLVARMTAEEQQQFAARVDADPVIAGASSLLRGRASGPVSLSVSTLDDVQYIDSTVREELRGDPFSIYGSNTITLGLRLLPVLARIVARYAAGRAHPGLCTITEEIVRAYYLGPLGTQIWTDMKGIIDRSLSTQPDAGGRALVDELAALLNDRPDVNVTLIGHSAGSIFVTRVLEALATRSLPTQCRVDVVFLAAVVTAASFAKSLTTIDGLIGGFRSFQLADAFEATDSILTFGQKFAAKPAWTVLYPASLPYAVSGVLEDSSGDTPLVGMARYFDDNVYESPEFATSIGVVSTFGKRFHTARVESLLNAATRPPGEQSEGKTHGDLPRDCKTLDSTLCILKDGVESAAGPGGSPPSSPAVDL